MAWQAASFRAACLFFASESLIPAGFAQSDHSKINLKSVRIFGHSKTVRPMTGFTTHLTTL
jgi:hypothetical protein